MKPACQREKAAADRYRFRLPGQHAFPRRPRARGLLDSGLSIRTAGIHTVDLPDTCTCTIRIDLVLPTIDSMQIMQTIGNSNTV